MTKPKTIEELWSDIVKERTPETILYMAGSLFLLWLSRRLTRKE